MDDATLLERAVYALNQLVEAKDEKDKHGETARYQALKVGAWNNARTVLKEAREMKTIRTLG